jgi:N-methylhydantoinase A/oxoprolinase/acetone carboxylase beta subunit
LPGISGFYMLLGIMEKQCKQIGLGIDVGGTYTDAVIYSLSEKKLLSKKKALTTKWDFTEGIRQSLLGFDQDLLAAARLIALSSTLATNAIVENKGQKVGLLLMPPYGLFEPDDIAYDPKAVISGRLEITGVPLQPINELEISRIAKRMVGHLGVKAFAVSGFAGVINPEHELSVKRILRDETGLFVSCGHELSDILDFRTRAYTAVMNGRIVPLLTRLLADLEEVLRTFGIRAPITVVRGDGSLMRKEAALEKPVETILSGPAASVAGAQHLTGKQNAIVVDMGGTTTDTAMLCNGRVETNDGGSNVGGHQTHVQALRIRTLGLGGDSFIVWDGDQFEIGPQRVASMAWAGDHVAGVDQALDYALEHLHNYGYSTKNLQVLVRQGHVNNLPLSSQEKDILGLLEERAFCPYELAKRIGMSYWSPGIIARLEENHLIQRCGFTPTDVLHCRGDISLWNAKISMKMRDILCIVAGKSPAAMIDELMQEVTRKFALVLLKRQLDEEIDPEGLENCPVCRAITGNMFGNGSGEYEIRLKTHKPIIGIGAPVYLFLPAAASLLGADHILPEHADVANAIGAITSKVIIRRRAEIRASNAGGFRIEGLPGNHYFRHFQEALAWTEKELTQIARDAARQSGTAETAVDFHVVDQTHTKSGNLIMMGCKVLAELKGEPSY